MELVQSKQIYRGRVFDVLQDQLRLPDGRLVELDIVDHPAAVTMIPVDQDGNIWFIRQYRHSARKFLLELPAGCCEPGEIPEVSAQRELQEEIGMAAEKLQEIGGFFMAAGYSTEYMHIFLARGLYSAPLEADKDEILTIEKVSAPQAIKMAETNQIEDSKTLVALFWLRPYLIQHFPTSGEI